MLGGNNAAAVTGIAKPGVPGGKETVDANGRRPSHRQDNGGSNTGGPTDAGLDRPAQHQPHDPEDVGLLDVRQSVGVFGSTHGRYARSLSRPVSADASNAPNDRDEEDSGSPLIAMLPPVYPEWLGTRRFTTFHGCRFPYVVGAMARGIATSNMVVEAAKNGLIGFFGAAGLRPPVVAEAIDQIEASVSPGTPWGSNLIHTPNHPERERDMVDLYLKRAVRRVSASAFMALSPDIVRYSARGITVTASGEIERKNHVFAKISRPEVAAHFLAPPPSDLLRELAAAGEITEAQADHQSKLPVAEDITVEADSGGHTDNRPLAALFPIIAAQRDHLAAERGYTRPVRLGAAGGIGTPHAVAAAFQLGADYVLTGSINQAAIESGLSEDGRAMLADCGVADVMMAPAADMFERGAKVQVLKKGTLFAVKAQRLYEIYRKNDAFDTVPAKDRAWLESQVFDGSYADAWARTRDYQATSNPALAAKADNDPKLQLAMIFRRFLFMASRWACDGNSDRRADYQIWCGPAMGSFNAWVGGSFLEASENRTVGQIALNLLWGACIATRVQQLRVAGIDVPDRHNGWSPKRIALG